MSYFESEKVKQTIALSILIILGAFLFFSLTDFIPAFLGAVIFYIICSPLMNFLHVNKKIKKGLAAAIVLISSFLIIMIPIFILGDMLISKLTTILSNNTTILLQIQHANAYVKEYIGFDILSQENLLKIQETITQIIPNLLNQTFSILADIGIMYFILFYLLYVGYDFRNTITRYLPYTKENSELFANELTSQTYSNIIGAPLLAIIQGIFAMLCFVIFGLNEPFFWGVMCGFLSFIPFVGTALIWIPAGLVQLSMGEQWQGIGILIYGALIITNIDNVFRFVLQKKLADIHPLITVFGVIIGLNWFGLPGLIFGPILISYFLIMIKIYRKEYGSTDYKTD
ncbi:MAG: AI-2E family transporter [Bacteroidota bacterium]